MDPFRNSDAPLLGISAKALRGPTFRHPVGGVSLLATRTALDDTCVATALALPGDAVFTHVTAARLRGWWMPLLDDLPIVACTDGEAPHLDRRCVYVRRCAIPAEHRTRLRAVPVASAAWTIVELAEHFALIDLVVVIDSALHAGDVTVDDIRATMRRGRRGVRVLRQALELCDARSESAWETVLRLLHELSGVGVEPQVIITDAAGAFLARADLRIAGTDRLAEYDGADHRDRSRHERDLQRDKALARAGYQRYGYIASEILREPERIIGDAFDALGRPRAEASARLWRDVADRSSLSPWGRDQLRRRLRRFARPTSPRSSGANR